MNNYTIVKNVLDEHSFTELFRYIHQQDLDWYYSPDVTGDGSDYWKYDEKIVRTSHFTHLLIDGEYVNKNFPNIVNIIKNIIKGVGKWKEVQILRAKLNMLTNNSKMQPDFYNTPHVDYMERYNPITSAILYLDNADGDTFLFNERYKGENLKKWTVNTRITPEKNKLVYFDNVYYHASQNPIKHEKRIVLNLNFKVISAL